MNHEFLLSIVIPHYNSPRKLKRLLDTIPIYKEIQVIVIDDISNEEKDEYIRIKEEYKDKVEFYDNLVENKSAGGARNIGLQKAKGKWLLFADADDFFLETFWSTIQDYMNAEEDVIFFPPLAVKEGTRRASRRAINFLMLALNAWQEKVYYKEITRKTELNIRYRWSSPCSKLIRKEIVDKYKICFDVVKYSNDVTFSSKLGFFARKINVSYEPIYVITEGTDSLTTKRDDPEEENIRFGILKNHCNFWRDNLSYEDCLLLFPLSKKEKAVLFIKKKILKNTNI